MKNAVNASILGLLFLATSSAFAADVRFDLKVGESVCLQRKYTSAHMAKHPAQKLSEVYVSVAHVRETYEDGSGSYDYTAAKVIGIAKNESFGNTLAGCLLQADGKLHCFVECDGGAFTLKGIGDQASMRVDNGYYFPLFRSGTEQYGEKESDRLALEGDDENGHYILYPADKSACDAAIQKFEANYDVNGC